MVQSSKPKIKEGLAYSMPYDYNTSGQSCHVRQGLPSLSLKKECCEEGHVGVQHPIQGERCNCVQCSELVTL